MRRIKKCVKCLNYTMKDICPLCGEQTKIAHPISFKFAKYLKYTTNNYDDNNKGV